MNGQPHEKGTPLTTGGAAGHKEWDDCTTINLLHDISRDTQGSHRHAGGTLACSVYRTIRQIETLCGE
jgi:hypothetical protein